MRILQRFAAAVLATLAAVGPSLAEAPSGYYSGAENKSGRSLLSALHDKIGPHTTVSYDGLLSLYNTTDVYPNGKIWDMYSTKEWSSGSTCGNYKNVGDCWNREHSFPKSWFSKGSPMNSDAFHVYPTDGKVNGQRSNYPYGECSGGTYLAANDNVRPLGRLGRSTFAGYSGTVFEPDDQYKGDFARSYFYMAACYYDKIANWDSPMLAGNNFPAFSQWAVNLLLKWHRQDPVSDKERNRNDAVYARQRNRNPFIDHPELAEHIWGNKSTVAWTSAGTAEPEIVLPAQGASVDFGTTAVGHPATRSITVRTANATQAITITVSGAAFSASATSIAAASANLAAGAPLNITYNPTATGSHSGTLTVSCGAATRTVALSGAAVDGLPAGPARYVTDQSFQATWVYIGDDRAGNYTLDVRQGAASIDGYPRAVPAAAAVYTVDGLEPSTAYTYTVASTTMTSVPVAVTTGIPVPSIEFLFDGDLFFSTTPGEPSEAAELLMETDNIEGDVTVTIDAPFELSTDRSNWSTSITVPTDQGRLYLRLNAAEGGAYTGSLVAVAGDYTSESIEVEGVASLTPDFLEDFEADAAGFGTYDPAEEYNGTACRWIFTNTGIWNSDPAASGDQSVRMGKSATSCIAMAVDRETGIGTVSFKAKYWGSEANPVLEVQVSTDGGENWKSAGAVTVSSSTYQEYSVFVGQSGRARMRLQQTSGSRLNIDDVAITRHTSGLDDPTAERHAWDARCLDGALTVDADRTLTAGIYALDGTTVYYGTLTEGSHSFDVVPGLYIVVVGDFARRVVVR